MMNVHDVTAAFEDRLCDYTGAPYCVTFDSQSNAMFSVLRYLDAPGIIVECPKHTYMSAPQMIVETGHKIRWVDNDKFLSGAYRLNPLPVIDSALRFTAGMYEKEMFMCLSFTGPYKHLKLGKAGAVLTDNQHAAQWLRRFRYNGRNPVSYHTDIFDMPGYNFYLLPEIAARGLRDIEQFYYEDKPLSNQDITLPYPDLSKHPYFVLHTDR